MQAELREEKLAFVNQQAGFDHAILYGVDNFVEGNHTAQNSVRRV